MFAAAEDDLAPRERDALLAEALRGLVRSYADDPPPATFRLLVSPMVTWIWIGALVVFLGGLIALWPSPRAVGRRVTAAYAARVGREARARATVELLDRPAGHLRGARRRGADRGRAAATAGGEGRPRSAARAELEAARDAKYREIRDAELDYRTGKLSEADWRELDRGLRAEAVEILRRLDELDAPASDGAERS